VKKLRDAGPVLVVDAGNALFETAFTTDAKSRPKAELILKTMGEVKTAAMAAGARDLTLGPEFLAQTAHKAGVPVLSANLTKDGKLLFPASTVVTVNGVKIGLLGISPVSEYFDRFPGLHADPPVKAALAEARKLRGKVDLLVALAAIPWADALQLTKEGGSLFDFIVESGESRGLGVMQRNDRGYLLSGGERGRGLDALELDLSPPGDGPLVDLGEVDREAQRRRNLEVQVDSIKLRVDKETDPNLKKSFEQALASFQDQLRQIKKDNWEQKAKGARTVHLQIQYLDASVADDLELKAQVDRLK
jgi:2',3'-cyclic-nucleotide 2'-phosphodiesterase (5'-nucleotidase family)